MINQRSMPETKVKSNRLFTDKKVLVIDDSIMIIQSLRGVLREIGFVDTNIQHSENASKALYLCKQRNFDCILCDFNLLTGLNGKQLFEEILYHNLQPIETVFIMITGESRRTIVNGIAELLPDEYILKPYTFKQIRNKISRSMKRRLVLIPVLEAMAKKDHQLALNECNRLLSLRVGFKSHIKLLKGKLLLLLGRAAEAKELYNQLVQEKVGIWSSLGLANSMAALEEFDEAKSLLNELMERDNQQVATLTTAATIHLQNNEIPSAIEYFKLASELSPINPDRELITANLCTSVNDYTSAIGHYSRYLDLSMNTYRETSQVHLNPIRCMLYVAEQLHHDSKEESINIAIKARQQLVNFNQQHYSPDIAGDIAAIYAHIAMLGGFINKAVGLLKNSLEEGKEDFYSHFYLATLIIKYGFEKQYLSTVKVSKHLIKDCKDKIIAQSQIAMLKALQEQVSKKNKLISQKKTLAENAEQQNNWQEAQEHYLQIHHDAPYLPLINLRLLKTFIHCWPANMSKAQVKCQLQHCDTVIQLFLSEERRQQMDYPSIRTLAWRNYGIKKQAALANAAPTSPITNY